MDNPLSYYLRIAFCASHHSPIMGEQLAQLKWIKGQIFLKGERYA